MGRTSLFFLAGFALVGIMSTTSFAQSSGPGMMSVDTLRKGCEEQLKHDSNGKINIRVLVQLLLKVNGFLSPQQTTSIVKEACSAPNTAPGISGVISLQILIPFLAVIAITIGVILQISVCVSIMVTAFLGGSL